MPPADTKTLGVAVLDYDGDGRPDLYFVNDRVSNRLFRNRGDGTFEETTAETGAGVLGDQPRAGNGRRGRGPVRRRAADALRDELRRGAQQPTTATSTGRSSKTPGRRSGARDDRACRSCAGERTSPTSTTTAGPTSTPSAGISRPRIVRMRRALQERQGGVRRGGRPRASRRRRSCCSNSGGGRFEEWADAGDLAATAHGRAGQRGGRHRRRRRPRPLRRGPRRAGPRLFAEPGREPAELDRDRAAAAGRGRRTVLGTRVGVTAGGRTQVADVPGLALLRLGLARPAPLRPRRGRDGGRDRGPLARRRRRRRSGTCRRGRPTRCRRAQPARRRDDAAPAGIPSA